MLRQLATFSGFTFLSRILGLIREMLLSYTLGACFWSDIFIISFRVPNFLRRIFAEGAMQGALVPELTHGNKFHLAQQVFTLLSFILLVLVVVVEYIAPYLLWILASGYVSDPYKSSVATQFIRITFPYILTISLCAVLAAVLNSKRKFAAESSAPVFLNIIMIFAIMGAKHWNGNVAYVLVWAVLFGGIAQLFYLYYFCRKIGFRLRLVKPDFSKDLMRVLNTFRVNIGSAGIMQLNILIDSSLASWLPTGSITHLFYADRIFQFPLSVIGVSLGSVLLPNFTRLSENPTQQKKLLFDSLTMAFQVAVCASIGMCILSDLIIYTVFCRGEFTQSNCACTGPILWAYGLSLPAYIMAKVLNSYCFAHKNPKIPMRAAMISLFSNIIGNIVLMQVLGCLGMALATSCAAWLNVMYLLYRVFKNEIVVWLKNLAPSIAWAAIHGLWLYLYKINIVFLGKHWTLNLATICVSGGLLSFSYFWFGHKLKIQNFYYKLKEAAI